MLHHSDILVSSLCIGLRYFLRSFAFLVCEQLRRSSYHSSAALNKTCDNTDAISTHSCALSHTERSRRSMRGLERRDCTAYLYQC